jgi:tetratricopeptide (TPR) repeat protein
MMAEHLRCSGRLKFRVFCCWVAALAMAASLPSCFRAQSGGRASFQELAQRADAEREAGQIESAIDLYRQALMQKADWQQGWWYYGSLLYDNNEYSPAVDALRHLTALNPQLGGAWALLGLSEYETGQFDVSLRDLDKAKAIGTGSDPNIADVVDYHVAVLLNARGEPEAANLLLATLLRKGRASEDLQVALGLALLRVPLLPSQVDPSKDALLHDAGDLAAAVERRQFDEAGVGFRNLAAKYPRTSFVHYAWGTMLAEQGKDDAAEEQFREETKITPNSSLAYTEWAFLEAKATHYEDAASLARKALQISPDAFIAHYVLGQSLLATGKPRAAVTELEHARDLAPESPEIRYSLSRAYAKTGQNALSRQEQAEFLRLKKLEQETHAQTEMPAAHQPEAESPASNQ